MLTLWRMSHVRNRENRMAEDDGNTGNTTVTFTQGKGNKVHTVHGFTAGPGYDLASGAGTVNALNFVPELAGQNLP
jgi:hypothetical protein